MGGKSKQGQFCWNELMTNNVPKAKEFYSSLFGWETQDLDMGHSIYTLLKQGDKDIGGMMQIPSGQEEHTLPHWISYVCVGDLNQTVKKAKSLGASMKQEPIALGKFGHFAVVQDPTGGHIALWQPVQSPDSDP